MMTTDIGSSSGSSSGSLPLRRAVMCVAEARVTVQINFLLRYLTGAWLSSAAGGGEPVRAAWGAISWTLAVFAVYLYNGVTDMNEDRLNGSRRPIARGELPPSFATGVAAASALVSVAAAVPLGPAWTVMAMLFLALGYLYSGPPFQLKRRTSATVVIGLTASVLTYCAGAYAYAGELHADPTLIVFVLAASLWTGLVGSTTKDLPDLEGDAAAGRVTYAAVHGERALRRAAVAVSLALPAVVTVAVVLLDVALLLPTAAMWVGGVVIALLCRRPIPAGPRRGRPYAVFMVTQYVLHACVIVPALSRDWLLL